jgi:hypothetical protein
MLCTFCKRTTSYNKIKTIYEDDSMPYPTTVTITEEQFNSCVESACQLYDKIQCTCKLGGK